MSFSKGDLFHIEMRNGIYQLLDLYKTENDGNVYYFRKVFDNKLNLKVSKAEFVHESWMAPISNKTREKLSDTLSTPEVQEVLNDLTIDRKKKFTASIRLEINLCTMDPKNKRKIEKQLNDGIQGIVNTFELRNAIRKLNDDGELHIETELVYPTEDKRLYRVELGRYCDDFDEYGAEFFREVRFTEVKVYRRQDLY